MNYNYYLSHGGPGSGRYPLGSGERPYQKFEGSGRRRILRSGGVNTKPKRSYGLGGYLKARKAKKAEEKQQQLTEEAAQRKRQHDADRERVLRKGTATEVLKYQGELTNKELGEVTTRLNLERQLRSLSSQEAKSAIDSVDNIMKTVKTGTEWAKIGIDTYNTFVSVYNSTPDGKKKPLTVIRKGSGDDGKKK